MILENENLIQFIKYAFAGGLATLTHLCLFHLLAWKCFPALQEKDPFVRFFKIKTGKIDDQYRSRNSMIANVLSFMLANLVAYITNVLWVFEAGRHHISIEILLFYAVSGISLFLGTVLMGVLIRRCGVLTTYAYGVNIFTAVMINYVVRKFFIFNG